MNDDDSNDYEVEVATIGPRHLELRVYAGDGEPGVRIATAAPPWVRKLPAVRPPNVLALRRVARR